MYKHVRAWFARLRPRAGALGAVLDIVGLGARRGRRRR